MSIDVSILCTFKIDDFMNVARCPDSSLALSMGHNRVGISFPSHEDKNRSSFRNVVFSIYLEF
jgi:hypothetical protein